MMRTPITSILLLYFASAVFSDVTAQSSESRTNDLRIFRSQFFDRDRSYSDEKRSEAESLLVELEGDPNGLSEAGFQLALARIAALAGNAHTVLLNPRWTQLFNRIDLQLFISSDGLFIGGTGDSVSELIGQRVDRIEGRTLDELRDEWSKYQSGREGWLDVFLPYFLESPEVLHAAGIAEHPDRITLTLGDHSQVEVEAGTSLEPLVGFQAVIPPPRALVLSEAGFTDSTPIYLQEPDEVVRRIDLPEHDAVYIQFRSNFDPGGSVDVKARSDAIAGDLSSNPPRYVILDQRMNFGGDLNNTRNLMQKLPEIVGAEGRVFILTSGRTFSAGISSVGYAKQAGGDRVTIIGTPVGDVLDFWAEGGLVSLPGTQAGVFYATERHNYMTGCPESDCHGSIRQHPIRVNSVDPDEPVEMTYADFSAGRDPLFDRAIELIEDAEER